MTAVSKIFRKLRAFGLAVLAVWVLWTAVTHPDQPRTYCGTCGHHVVHRAPARHAVRR